jgi:hypothetical protein
LAFKAEFRLAFAVLPIKATTCVILCSEENQFDAQRDHGFGVFQKLRCCEAAQEGQHVLFHILNANATENIELACRQ